MALISRIDGIPQMLARLQKVTKAMEDSVRPSMIKGGLLVQRDSQLEAPVEFGFLKASAFTRAEGTGFKTQVVVGYTAAYALFVHEKIGMVLKGQARKPNPPHKGRYWDPQNRAKARFLADPLRNDRERVMGIIRDGILKAKQGA